MGWPTTKIEELPKGDLIGKISEYLNINKPETVYLPFYNDAHSDHRFAFECLSVCMKSFRYPFVKNIFMMETISETDYSLSLQGSSFVPNYFVDVSKYIKKKIEIMNVFESEIQEPPFPRSIEAIESLARVRGATSYCEFAESFMLLKSVER